MIKQILWCAFTLMTLAFISDVAITAAQVSMTTILKTTGWSQTYKIGRAHV